MFGRQEAAQLTRLGRVTTSVVTLPCQLWLLHAATSGGYGDIRLIALHQPNMPCADGGCKPPQCRFSGTGRTRPA